MEYYSDIFLQALYRNHEALLGADGIYSGASGCKALARDFGLGLSCFDSKQINEELHDSYGRLCVRAYNLKPPIDAKDWMDNIRIGLERGGINIKAH